MNKIEVFPKTSLKISRYNRRAVSDVVAVLILIVIAIIGAVAVGYIITTSSHSVGSAVATQGNGNSAQSNLYIGGSTTVYPVTQDAAPTFESTYHINIVDAQGGSGGGMQGVIDGALDIGAASSLAAVYSAVTYVSANSITGVNLQAFQVGGSGNVPITTSLYAVPGTKGATMVAAFLSDGTNYCEDISAAAFTAMYTDGFFYIIAGACTLGNVANTGGATGTLTAAGVTTTAAGNIGPYQTISRADNSGTADAWAGWLGVSPSTYPLLASDGATGNPGVLLAVQKCGTASDLTTGSYQTGTVGCVGYVDLGFGEGNVAGLSCGSGWTASTPCGVAIPQASSNDGAGIDPIVQCTSSAITPTATAGSCWALGNIGGVAGTTTSGLHTTIENALKLFSNANPYLNSGYTVSYPDTSAKSTGLVKVFFYVTNGTPTPTEQTFINFMLSPNAQSYFNTNGYFAWVQYAAA